MGFRTQKKSNQIGDGQVKEVDIDFGLGADQVNADSNPTDTSNFDLNLSSSDDTVQKALDTIDDIDFEALIEAGIFKFDYDEFDFGTDQSGSIGTWGWVKYNISGTMRIDYVDPVGRVGVIKLTTSTGKAGGTLSTSAANTLYSHGGLRFRASMKLGTNITGVSTYIGLHDLRTSNSEPTNGIYLKIDTDISNYWQAVTSDNGSRTETATSVLGVADTWLKLEAIVNEANSSVEFLINDVSVATNTTNIPDSVGRYFSPAITVISRDNAAKDMSIDYYSVKYPILDR